VGFSAASSPAKTADIQRKKVGVVPDMNFPGSSSKRRATRGYTYILSIHIFRRNLAHSQIYDLQSTVPLGIRQNLNDFFAYSEMYGVRNTILCTSEGDQEAQSNEVPAEESISIRKAEFREIQLAHYHSTAVFHFPIEKNAVRGSSPTQLTHVGIPSYLLRNVVPDHCFDIGSPCRRGRN